MKKTIQLFLSISIFLLNSPQGSIAQNNDPIFTIVEEMPVFKGGEYEMDRFIKSNINCPDEAKKKAGIIYISFIIDTNGNVNNPTILKGIEKSLDEEAIRVVNKTNGMWLPGKQDGHKLNVQFNLSINFSLSPNMPKTPLVQSKILLSKYTFNPLPKVIEKTKGELSKYSYKDTYNKYGIEFLSDSSYIYYALSSSYYEISVGKYNFKKNVIVLNWDSLKTHKAVNDPQFYIKYFKHKKPESLKIIDARYERTPTALIADNTQNIEIFFTSKDIFKEGLSIDSILEINYNLSGDKIIITKESKKNIAFKIDTLWGYKLRKNNSHDIFRKVYKGTNWYNLPGLQVAQIDSLIIYILGAGKTYAYFSKNLDSQIYSLNTTGIKEAFKDNKQFAEVFVKELNKLPSYTSINEETKSFRIIEVYRKLLDTYNRNPAE